MTAALRSPLHGSVVEVVAAGTTVAAGAVIALVESMKMHHEVRADGAGTIAVVHVIVGQNVQAGDPLVELTPGEAAPDADDAAGELHADEPAVRADLELLRQRKGFGADATRSAATAKRHAGGRRTARENIADLVDAGSFVEFGPLAVAAQRARRDADDLMRNTPGDGLVGGLATINGDRFSGRAAKAVVATYDYTVLAGTQGVRNHAKKDRLFELAERLELPVVLFAEGGGGRPGDTETPGPTGLDCLAFLYLARLSGLVPLVGIGSGYCFAGNAALLGVCDVVIATADANIGMGGPAMIEGGGLGTFAPTDIGPLDTQRANGVVDLVAADDAEAVALAKRYLSYFQGPLTEWSCADQELLRTVIPEDRVRAYDVRLVLEGLFDTASVLELRRDFGCGMITALARVEGRAVGVLANNPAHLGGAVEADGADKAARFMQLCDAFDLPLITLCDTPGFMVGPDSEAQAMVRHASRMFVTGANVTIPTVTVVLRKGYGLGAQAMMGGSTKAPLACVGWPTSEFGGMGLEGAVALGYRRELDATEGPEERQALFDRLVAGLYEVGRGVNVAQYNEIDDVIDPADTRRWLVELLAASPVVVRSGKKRRNIDTW